MDDFEQLKNLWQQQPIRLERPDSRQLKKTNADNHRKLERVQLRAAIILLATSAFLIWMGFFSHITFRSSLTYVAVGLLALIPALQSVLSLRIYQRLRSINVAAPVAQHLRQWQDYYAFRKRLVRLNFPIYYLLLNGAFALYFIEILGHFSLTGRLVALTLYTAWMLFAYFVLGKRSLKKEYARLEAIISNLQTMQNQLADSKPEDNLFRPD